MRTTIAAITLVMNAGLALAATPTITKVIQTGDSVPGISGASVDFAASVLVSAGTGKLLVDATAAVAGSVTEANNSYVLFGPPTGLSLLARKGDAAPGTGGATFTSFEASNFQGNTPFLFTQLSGGDSDYALFSGAPGALSLLARHGQPVPGASDSATYFFRDAGIADLANDNAYLSTSISLAVNANGRLAFLAELDSPSIDLNDPTWNNLGLFVGNPGSLQMALRRGSAAPGTPAGVKVRNFRRPAMNDAGTVAFPASFTGPGVVTIDNTNSNDEGLYVGTPGNLTLVHRAGTTAPGFSLASDVIFRQFIDVDFLDSTPSINNTGDMVFLAGVDARNYDPTTTPLSALYRRTASGTSLIFSNYVSSAPGFGTVPGTNPPRQHRFVLIDSYIINASSTLVFYAQVADIDPVTFDQSDYRQGLYTGPLADTAQLTLFVKDGDVAPGTEPGTVFDNFDTVSINTAGRIVFGAALRGPAVIPYDPNATTPQIPTPTDNALYVRDNDGTLSLLARTGVPFAPSGGKIPTGINTAYNAGGQDGQSGPLRSDDGVAFGLFFEDGSSGTYYASFAPTAPTGCNKADVTDNAGGGAPDGKLSAQDVVTFFASFFSPCTAPGAVPCNKADITDASGAGGPEGALTAQDVVTFFTAFFAGCPL